MASELYGSPSGGGHVSLREELECLRRLQYVQAGISAIRRDLTARKTSLWVKTDILLRNIETQLDGRTLEYLALHLEKELLSLGRLIREYGPDMAQVSEHVLKSVYEQFEICKEDIQDIIHESWRTSDALR